jgi:hypothetical protein
MAHAEIVIGLYEINVAVQRFGALEVEADRQLIPLLRDGDCLRILDEHQVVARADMRFHH